MLSLVQKLHSYTCTLIKAPPPFASDMFTYQTATALLIVSKFTQTRLFLLFLAFCRIRFLTLINNSLTISQRTKTARKPESLHPSVSVVSWFHWFLGAKL